MSEKLELKVRHAYWLEETLNKAAGSDGSKWTESKLWLLESEYYFGKILDILQGRADIVPIEEVRTIVHIDRSVPPVYPNWVQETLCPELENIGPEELDLAKLVRWQHPDQGKSYVKGEVLYQYLKDSDILRTCLGFREMEEIRKKGVNFFRKYFGDKYVSCWKGIARAKDGRHPPSMLFVPTLWASREEVYVNSLIPLDTFLASPNQSEVLRYPD